MTQNKKSSIFVTGARPFIMWILGLSLAWQFLIAPVAVCIFAIFDVHLYVISLDIENILAILFGMLGLGTLRTYEKNKGVARETI